MTDIDRNDKNVILADGKVVPYDTLVLAMGIQEKTLDDLGFASWGISPVPADIKRCRGVLSIDDPHLYDSLSSNSDLLNKLTDRRRGMKCVIYGLTLNVFALIQGLVERGVQYKNIIVAEPRRNCHANENEDCTEELDYIYPTAFEDEQLLQKMKEMLQEKGVTFLAEHRLMEIHSDKNQNFDSARASQHQLGNDQTAVPAWDADCNLERIVLKDFNIKIDEEEEEEEIDLDDKSQSSHQNGEDAAQDESGVHDQEERSMIDDTQAVDKKKKRKKNEKEIECGVLITCGHRDVDNDVFSSIHNNGLVYNGRLIVDKNFRTTDHSIFAAGSLCEFSGRYASLSQGRSLRMDRYNGREMGSRLARSVFDLYDPQAQIELATRNTEELPLFYIPSGQGAVLPNNLIYYHIKTTNPIQNQPEHKNREDLVCDNLNVGTGKGHWIKFAFNSIGLIDSVTYMGSEEVILQSLWSFVGLHENYLNSLTSRYPAGIIPNVVEFLSENWAIALYHEWFGDFCLRMRTAVRGLADVQEILHTAFEATKRGQGLTREDLAKFRKSLDEKTIRMIEDETLEFIKTNMNHLPMYYIPGQEFA